MVPLELGRSSPGRDNSRAKKERRVREHEFVKSGGERPSRRRGAAEVSGEDGGPVAKRAFVNDERVELTSKLLKNLVAAASNEGATLLSNKTWWLVELNRLRSTREGAPKATVETLNSRIEETWIRHVTGEELWRLRGPDFDHLVDFFPPTSKTLTEATGTAPSASGRYFSARALKVWAEARIPGKQAEGPA